MYSRYEQRRSYCATSSGRRFGDGNKGNGNDSGEMPQGKEMPIPKQTVSKETPHKQGTKAKVYSASGPSATGPVGAPGRSAIGSRGSTGFFQQLPPFLRNILPGKNGGDMMAFLILLLLLWEGREDSQGTVLTLLLFLIL